MLSAKMEDYLKTVYELKEIDGAPVSTSSIAEYMDVTPPTVTSMMEKLEDRELVDREKYSGVELTPEGETVALEVLRHHRLIETYLAEQLDYDWAEVHDEADRLEHHISEEFERRVADALDDPAVDPHGDPIPTDSLDPLEETDGGRLDEYDEGAAVVVRRVRDRNAEELDYLKDAGLTPGTELTVDEVAPIGMVTVRFADDTTVSIPNDIAGSIHVTPATPDDVAETV
ncbi:iron (metal) dependent repressor, DtxR family [Halovenus aranensis]|jgi:DtxR family Mn-dependent transcriptional regulator|uniref:Iron (Metal) dependent repressor, DtxR family n=1 Tax=Halovenus aranensis TaxID=890420 RepID=A0A1G8S8P1_9EURY|nr:metal-dependent transcriptional regulator [Halovenus aranensis]SDJ25115.1 iron (metal) dependent repressor, DtxR family [Halovenus aranensis]